MTLEELEKRLRNTEVKLQDIEKRLTVAEDIEQIKQLTIKYVNCLMFAKWDEIMECFSESSVLKVFVERGPIKGLAEIEKTFREVVSLRHVGKEGDLLVHPLITVDGNTAKGNWLIYFMGNNDIPGAGFVLGVYETEYLKENGKWIISFIKWIPILFPPGFGPPPIKQ